MLLFEDMRFFFLLCSLIVNGKDYDDDYNIIVTVMVLVFCFVFCSNSDLVFWFLSPCDCVIFGLVLYSILFPVLLR